MTHEEQEQLKAEILATQTGVIDNYKAPNDNIQWLFGESNIPDILERSVYRMLTKIGKWTVCLIEKPKVIGIVTVLVILSVLLESQSFHWPYPEDIGVIRHEISQAEPWGNKDIPIINGFVIVPPPNEPEPHVPEKDFIANPLSTFSVASLSGLSLPISGKYQHN